MLETVREFGLDRLEASGEGEEMRRRQAAWCLAFAELAEPQHIGESIEPEWVGRLDSEMSNLRAVIIWLLERGEAVTVLRLLAATDDFLIHRYNYAEFRQWANAGLAAAPDAPAMDRSVVHNVLTFVDSMLGDHDSAVAHTQEALAAARESGDAVAIGLAKYNVGLGTSGRWPTRGGGLRRSRAALTRRWGSRLGCLGAGGLGGQTGLARRPRRGRADAGRGAQPSPCGWSGLGRRDGPRPAWPRGLAAG